MDGYAPAYVAHNVPYLVVSGLGSQPRNHADLKAEGVHIVSDVSPVESDDADALLKHFKDCDAEGSDWNDRDSSARNKFRIKIVGRVVQQTQ